MAEGDSLLGRHVQFYHCLLLILFLVTVVAEPDHLAVIVVSLKIEGGEVPEDLIGVDLAEPGKTKEYDGLRGIVNVGGDGIHGSSHPVVVQIIRPDMEELQETRIFGPVFEMRQRAGIMETI